jgi:hypothetical protein
MTTPRSGGTAIVLGAAGSLANFRCEVGFEFGDAHSWAAVAMLH